MELEVAGTRGCHRHRAKKTHPRLPIAGCDALPLMVLENGQLYQTWVPCLLRMAPICSLLRAATDTLGDVLEIILFMRRTDSRPWKPELEQGT